MRTPYKQPMPRQPGCHGSHFLGYFQEPGSGAESSSVAARLWAAITSRLPSARKIRAPTISRSVRICDPPWRRLSQTFRCPATMRRFASRIVPQLWARVLERLLLLEFGQEVGRNEPTRSPPADTARAALAKTSADSIHERPIESLSIFCKRIHPSQHTRRPEVRIKPTSFAIGALLTSLGWQHESTCSLAWRISNPDS